MPGHIDEDHDLLIRIDERTAATHGDIEEIKVVIDLLPKRFVTRAEFKPVRTVIYGMVGVIMTLALVGVLSYSFGAIG